MGAALEPAAAALHREERKESIYALPCTRFLMTPAGRYCTQQRAFLLPGLATRRLPRGVNLSDGLYPRVLFATTAAAQ